MTNAGSQGPDGLYEQRQPLMIPEEYMLSGATKNATMGTAEEARPRPHPANLPTAAPPLCSPPHQPPLT